MNTKLTYHQIKMLDGVRLKWAMSSGKKKPLRPFAVAEDDVRDLMLDWLIQIPMMDVWMNQTTGVFDKKINSFRKNNHRHYRKGIPDIIGSYCGVAIYIEVKRPKTLQQEAGSPSVEQVEFIKRAIQNNAIAFFAWDLDDVKEQLLAFAKGLGLPLEKLAF
ncbi:hypothetical protein MASR1M48_16620 [Lactococcus petauri]